MSISPNSDKRDNGSTVTVYNLGSNYSIYRDNVFKSKVFKYIGIGLFVLAAGVVVVGNKRS